MRKLLITLAAASAALVTAAPASAQGYYGGGYNQNRHHGYPGDRGLVQRFEHQIGNLRHRIERLAERRDISPGEYRALHNQAANLRQRLLTDPHSPSEQRVAVVRNLDPWYAAFGVEPGQKLYLAPPDRVRVW